MRTAQITRHSSAATGTALAAAALAGLLAAAPVSAQTNPTAGAATGGAAAAAGAYGGAPGMTTPGTSTTISLGGRQIMDIRTAAGGYTARERANAVRSRLVPLLSITDLAPADVVVRQARPGQDAAIYVRGHLLVTVDPTLAQVNGTRPRALASRWASVLRRELPRVNARPNPNGV